MKGAAGGRSRGRGRETLLGPPSADRQDAAIAASSIVKLSSSSSSRRSQRTANRDRRFGSFFATRAVRASAFSRLIRPSSRAVASAMRMFPRSIAVAKIRRGCPCAVTPSRWRRTARVSLTREGRAGVKGERARAAEGVVPRRVTVLPSERPKMRSKSVSSARTTSRPSSSSPCVRGIPSSRQCAMSWATTSFSAYIRTGRQTRRGRQIDLHER